MNPIYSLNMQKLSRSNGRNVVQMAAYISGQPMICQSKEGIQRFDRTDRTAEITTMMVGTKLSAEVLFNVTEAAERRKDSVVAREINCALPRGLSDETELTIIERFAIFLTEFLHTAVFAARHRNRDARKQANPHAHFLFPARPWDEQTQSFAAKKDRLLDSHRTGAHAVERIRRAWEEIVNEEIPANFKRIDRRSHVRRGDGRHARRHLGRAVFEWKLRNPGQQHPSEKFNELVDQHSALCASIDECDSEISRLNDMVATEEIRELRAARRREREQLLAKDAMEMLEPCAPSRNRTTQDARQTQPTAATLIEQIVRVAKTGTVSPPTAPHSQMAQDALEMLNRPLRRAGQPVENRSAPRILPPAALAKLHAEAADVLIPLHNANAIQPITERRPSSPEDSAPTPSKLPLAGAAHFDADNLIRVITSFASKSVAAKSAAPAPSKLNPHSSDPN